MTNPNISVLTDSQISSFINGGYVKISGAFSSELAAQCRDLLWDEIISLKPEMHRDDRTTWPLSSDLESFNVIRIAGSDHPAFVQAANTPRLHAAYDQLVGKYRWIPRSDMGSFPIPFPMTDPETYLGWHLDGCELIDGKYQLRFETECRILLMLFLFSDVNEIDAPTAIRVGSHNLVAPILHANKGKYMKTEQVTDQIPSLDSLPITFATGKAGDVYLCHPFLVHAGQANLSSTPRFLAQPPLTARETLNVERQEGYEYSPVETSVRIGLGLS